MTPGWSAQGHIVSPILFGRHGRNSRPVCFEQLSRNTHPVDCSPCLNAGWPTGGGLRQSKGGYRGRGQATLLQRQVFSSQLPTLGAVDIISGPWGVWKSSCAVQQDTARRCSGRLCGRCRGLQLTTGRWMQKLQLYQADENVLWRLIAPIQGRRCLLTSLIRPGCGRAGSLAPAHSELASRLGRKLAKLGQVPCSPEIHYYTGTVWTIDPRRVGIS